MKVNCVITLTPTCFGLIVDDKGEFQGYVEIHHETITVNSYDRVGNKLIGYSPNLGNVRININHETLREMIEIPNYGLPLEFKFEHQYKFDTTIEYNTNVEKDEDQCQI